MVSGARRDGERRHPHSSLNISDTASSGLTRQGVGGGYLQLQGGSWARSMVTFLASSLPARVFSSSPAAMEKEDHGITNSIELSNKQKQKKIEIKTDQAP